MKRSILIVTGRLGFLELTSAQSVPPTINYQGRLTDNSPQQNPVSATVPMQFAIYADPAAGTRLWREPDVDGSATPALTAQDPNVLNDNVSYFYSVDNPGP